MADTGELDPKSEYAVERIKELEAEVKTLKGEKEDFSDAVSKAINKVEKSVGNMESTRDDILGLLEFITKQLKNRNVEVADMRYAITRVLNLPAHDLDCPAVRSGENCTCGFVHARRHAQNILNHIHPLPEEIFAAHDSLWCRAIINGAEDPKIIEAITKEFNTLRPDDPIKFVEEE